MTSASEESLEDGAIAKVSTPEVIRLTDFADVKDAFRKRPLKQALYDEAAFIMSNTVIVLQGDEHNERRHLENALFERERLRQYESTVLPTFIDDALASCTFDGRLDAVAYAAQVTANISLMIAGIDRYMNTMEETSRLVRYLRKFGEGATIANSTRPFDELRHEVLEDMDAFQREYLEPSLARRRQEFDAVRAAPDGHLDVATILLDAHADDELIRREVIFYLLASASTSSVVFVNTLDEILAWALAHNIDLSQPSDDLKFLQRCAWESIRLHPPNPQHLRVALEPIELKSGREIPQGALVFFDMVSANRDVEVFGWDSDRFNPHRQLPRGVMPWGMGFGGGAHICAGQALAGGTPAEDLAGIMALMLSAVVGRGPVWIPGDFPALATHTTRRHWAQYPVLLNH